MTSEAPRFPSTVGVLGFRGGVLFPEQSGGLVLGATSAAVVDAAVAEGYVAVVHLRDSKEEFFDIGTLAQVIKVERSESRNVVFVRGVARCRVQLLASGPKRTRVEIIEPVDPLDDAGADRLRALGMQFLQRAPVPKEGRLMIRDLEEAGHLIDVLMGNIEFDVSEKLQILATASVMRRASLATEFLNRALSRLPPAVPSGAQCSVHAVQAVATCARCGAFICDVCRGPGSVLAECSACRQRAPDRAVRFHGLGLLSCGIGVVSIVAWRLFWPVWPFALIACGLGGIAAALASLWSKARFPHKNSALDLWLAYLGLGMNGLITIVELTAAVSP